MTFGAARDLSSQVLPPQIAWEAIALHTTPAVTRHMAPEAALLDSGVSLDVLTEQ